MQLSTLTDTIVAQATAPGTAAIAVIRVSGSNAIELVNSVFRGKDLRLQPSHTVHFGRILAPDGSVLDEVLVSLFRNPSSYT
ncbi:MAG: tRNA uridine-5-carboxymethylaminomethyl(34) synthesis GTPase MnmE, partial [Saprospiraceae bacterium]|nr:tRNA uridine-5-carboxymethylaminomethyl(34) synthesis GTPase MnmE [Saprospiraceae bacterium]